MIHHSNPKCDTCGYRHSPGHDGECLDCVLAQASEDIADLRTRFRGTLQRCIDAMTELLDAETQTSMHWAELRLAKNAAQQVIVDECSG
jgi:hypothetical protein